MSPQPESVSHILAAVARGERHAPARLFEAVYDELRRLAHRRVAREGPGYTLQTTELVHEAWLRLGGGGDAAAGGRRHFFACAAEAMRRILVERARAKGRVKRGGGAQRLDLMDHDAISEERPGELEALDEALGSMEEKYARMALVVKLRYFAGLTVDEVADALGIAPRTVYREWTAARAWLRARIQEEDA